MPVLSNRKNLQALLYHIKSADNYMFLSLPIKNSATVSGPT